MQAAEVWEANKGAMHLPAPNVTSYCIYGTNVETLVALHYSDSGFSSPTSVETTPHGDGTVPAASLEACSRWREEQDLPVHTHVFDGVVHSAILDDQQAFNAVVNAVVALHAGGAVA